MTGNGIHEALNRQLANWSVLYVKLHKYHWYVKGPHFFTLHAKFQELYEEAAARVDELAERLLAVGGRPAATMTEYLSLAGISERGDEGAGAEAMVASLAADLETVAGELQSAIAAAEEQGDEPTADLFTGILGDVQKHLWMLRAYLG